MVLPKYTRKIAGVKELEGVDLFVHWSGVNPNELAEIVSKITANNLKLSMITNRGIKVWPDGFKETFCTDHWRCRFKPVSGDSIEKEEIIEALQNALKNGVDVIKTENLYRFDGVSAYSLGQGQ
jgi:isocitrate dehydrogenase